MLCEHRRDLIEALGLVLAPVLDAVDHLPTLVSIEQEYTWAMLRAQVAELSVLAARDPHDTQWPYVVKNLIDDMDAKLIVLHDPTWPLATTDLTGLVFSWRRVTALMTLTPTTGLLTSWSDSVTAELCALAGYVRRHFPSVPVPTFVVFLAARDPFDADFAWLTRMAESTKRLESSTAQPFDTQSTAVRGGVV